MSTFKSYSSKRSAQKGAERAGVHPDMVIEVDGKWGFAELVAPQHESVPEGEVANNPDGTYSEACETPEAATTGRKVEKNRVTQNGVTRPSAGGKCRQVWDACDALVAQGTVPTPEAIKAWAGANAHNANNAQIELYNWRKFNGITGRVKVAPAATA